MKITNEHDVNTVKGVNGCKKVAIAGIIAALAISAMFIMTSDASTAVYLTKYEAGALDYFE